MGQFLNSINEVRKNYSKYDDWEQKQADERAQKEYLAANLEIPQDKLELTKKRAETVVRATEIMDARSEDNCENMEQLTSMLMGIPALGLAFAQFPLLNWAEKKVEKQYKPKGQKIEADFKAGNITHDVRELKLNELLKKRNKALKSLNNRINFGILGATFLLAIGGILWGNAKQKQASRIGRYQAKQNELNGVENFVVYTPEQIEKAKEIAKTIPDEKEQNSISKMLKELKDVIKDEKAYKEWLSKKDPDEIEKLKAVTLASGGGQFQRAQEDKELIVDAVKEINIKAEEYSENLENAFDTLGVASWLIAAPLGFGINKLLNAFKVKNNAVRIAVSVLVPAITSGAIAMGGTVEQKRASRIGRYKARQDLLKNPARLMAFSDEDMKKAENVKAEKQKQSFFEKLGGSFSFLSSYMKDLKEYKNYKKTTRKENEKIQKALKDIEITDAQKADAETLKKNVFRAFDEIDEMSQRYSEDTEAATEIAKQAGATVWSLASVGGMAWLAVAIVKGKFPIAKLGNWLTNLSFKADAPIKKAVNGVYEVLKKQDKVTVQKFQEAIVAGNMKKFFEYPQNAALKEAMTPLMEELGKVQVSNGLSESLTSQLKQTRVAKWTRNMIEQCLKLKIKSKAANAGTPIPEEVQKQMGMNFNYKNYKTLINTGIVAGVPVLGVILGIPYAFNAWLTSIQKKAGKIGIMKAMDKIDDPRVFVSDIQTAKEEQNASSNNPNSQNLLNKFKQQAI